MKGATRLATLLAFGSIACGEAAAPTGPLTVTFQNFLLVPVTIAVTGMTPLTLPAGESASVVLPLGTTSVDWTAVDRTFSNGFTLLDDLGTTTVQVGTTGAVELTNVVGAATYFVPRVSNTTQQNLSVALWDGSIVRCLGTQGNGSNTTWGYYLLGAATELRYYAPATSCTGNYIAVSRSTILSNITAKSGLVTLTNTATP